MLKNFLLFLSAISLLFAVSVNNAYATIVVDPATGWTGSFDWDDGLGPIDSIESDSANTDWSITFTQSGYIDSVTVWDAYVPGDEFEAVVNGSVEAWDNTWVDSDGYFHGEFTNIYVEAGTDILSLNVTVLADQYTDGSAFLTIGTFTPENPVPEPATMLLFGIGIIGLAGVSRKKRVK